MTPDEIMTSPTIFTIWPSNACTDSCQRTFSSLRPPINYTEKEIRRTVSFSARQMNRTCSNFCGTQGVPAFRSENGARLHKLYTCSAHRKELDVQTKVHASPVASHVEIDAFCSSHEANGEVKLPKLLPVNSGWKCMLCVRLN